MTRSASCSALVALDSRLWTSTEVMLRRSLWRGDNASGQCSDKLILNRNLVISCKKTAWECYFNLMYLSMQKKNRNFETAIKLKQNFTKSPIAYYLQTITKKSFFLLNTIEHRCLSFLSLHFSLRDYAKSELNNNEKVPRCFAFVSNKGKC